ncbi:MAG: hypothetical protein IT373_05215 [Polyangiaceae bacterium]|nr:hypothetical protein [Polyangiaceae bacterium]
MSRLPGPPRPSPGPGRPRARAALLGLGALVATLTGCATALGEFGDQARFAPAFRGYVMAQRNGSDDPGVDDAVLLLRDPLTGDKLRCRDEVLEWRELYEDLATDRVHDENVAVAVGATTGAVFAPLLAAYPVGGLVLTEAMLVSGALYEDFAADDAFELLGKGIALRERTRHAQAIAYLERALAKDPAVGLIDKAYYYLGLSYAERGASERARLALELFVDRAGVRDVEAYREAEATLERLGIRRAPCASTEPVALHF